MKWTDIPAGIKEAAEQRLWVALGREAGGFALRINTNPEYLEQLAKFAANPWPADENHTRSDEKSSFPPAPRFRFILPRGVAMVASVRHAHTDPTVELAIYRKDFDAGQFNDSLVSEGNFRELKVRNFYPGSGCGFVIKNKMIGYLEQGLQNFAGRCANVYATAKGNSEDALLVVWETGPVSLHKDFVKELAMVMEGFQMALV